MECKTLMKDGQWVVPEDQRPVNWKAYSKSTITHLVTKTEEKVLELEHAVKDQSPKETLTIEDVVETKPIEKIGNGFIPDSPDIEDLIQASIEYNTELTDEDWDTHKPELLSDKIGDLCFNIKDWREYKSVVENALDEWASRHETKLKRQLGFHNEIMKDLWNTVHQILFANVQTHRKKS